MPKYKPNDVVVVKGVEYIVNANGGCDGCAFDTDRGACASFQPCEDLIGYDANFRRLTFRDRVKAANANSQL